MKGLPMLRSMSGLFKRLTMHRAAIVLIAIVVIAAAAIGTNIVCAGSEEITINLPGGVPLVFKRIPAGSFQMGTPDTEVGHQSWEGPVHKVTIAYDFYMGKYEVTQAQWLALMGSWPAAPSSTDGVGDTYMGSSSLGTAPSSTYGVGDTYPAYYVSWDDAQSFITALNNHITSTGQGPLTVRLPSSSE